MGQKGDNGDGKRAPARASAETLPYPHTDLSPTLQRTIKRKLDNGELDEMEREELERVIRRAARPDRA